MRVLIVGDVAEADLRAAPNTDLVSVESVEQAADLLSREKFDHVFVAGSPSNPLTVAAVEELHRQSPTTPISVLSDGDEESNLDILDKIWMSGGLGVVSKKDINPSLLLGVAGQRQSSLLPLLLVEIYRRVSNLEESHRKLSEFVFGDGTGGVRDRLKELESEVAQNSSFRSSQLAWNFTVKKMLISALLAASGSLVVSLLVMLFQRLF